MGFRDLEDTSYLGDTFQASMRQLSVEQCKTELAQYIKNASSDKARAMWKSKLNLVNELAIMKTMPIGLAYEEYIGKIPADLVPHYSQKFNAVKAFVRSLLSQHGGLPVLIVNTKAGERFVTIYDHIGNNGNLVALREIDKIISNRNEKHDQPLEKLAPHFAALMSLTASAREKSVMIATLAVMFSSTSLRQYLDIHEDHIAKLKKAVFDYSEARVKEESTVLVAASQMWENTCKNIENQINEATIALERNMKNLSQEEQERRATDISKKRERLHCYKKFKTSHIKRSAALAMKKWKQNIFSQHGKGKGNYRIDRGAEMAVFNALQEQLVAHVKRKDAPQLERRMHTIDMLGIANRWLKSHGKKLIKSKETVRSWARPKNLRSKQSKQHRGRALFRYGKAKKNFTEAHVNMHYNRAHIKQFTRMVFSKNGGRDKYAPYTIRRCLDDKATLKCGTSEGFARPRTKPVLLITDEAQSLPAYDFPEVAGYVSPGVNLIINDMAEVEIDGRDVYALTSATINVHCKPKVSYSSSSTKWANDMYADRLKVPQEHEVENTGLDIDRSAQTGLVFLKDTLKQFEMMNIREDVENAFVSDEHLEREILRIHTLINRLQYVRNIFQQLDIHLPATTYVASVMTAAQQLLIEIQDTHEDHNAQKQCVDQLERLGYSVHDLFDKVAPLAPLHKPIDIQTTDAGPGVGTSEELVRLRLTESFLINDLDMQVRMHYAPRDSKSHKVEQVMSALNEACGDGRFIDVPQTSVMDSLGEKKLLDMNSMDFENLKKKNSLDIGDSCAKQVASRYEGTRCMGTTIRACVPNLSNPTHTFFFDEKYMKKCHEVSSAKALSQCPGHSYYQFLQQKHKEIYVRYNNGIEGLRTEGEFRCPYQVKRIPAPLPDYARQASGQGFHYYRLGCEEYDSAENRQVDDYNPMVQLNKLVDSAGDPEIAFRKQTDDDTTCIAYDANGTWDKIQNGLPNFLAKYTGNEFHDIVKKEVETKYLSKLRKTARKLEKQNVELNTENLVAIRCGALKVKIKKTSACPPPLPWNGTYNDCDHAIKMTNTCTVDNALYIIHVALTDNEGLETLFRTSSDPVLNRLHRIHKRFERGDFSGGKYLWYEQFPELVRVGCDTIDSYGAEDDYFFNKLKLQTQTVFESVCSNSDCQYPCVVMNGTIITHSPADDCGDASSFQESINHWIKNKKSKRCTKQSNGGINQQCNGVRHYREREFVHESAPAILPIDVSNCPWHIPNQLNVKKQKYTLAGITYGNGGHFVANVHIHSQKRWVFYDGLKEHVRKGSGLKRIAKPTTPHRYNQSYSIFVKY